MQLDASARFDLGVPAGWGGILIALEGGINAGGAALAETQAIGFAADDADTITLTARHGSARLVVIAGAQLHQPLFAHGPLMMASAAALDKAMRRVSTLSL